MEHQPFENWLLDKTLLSVNEQKALRQHLGSCHQCEQLSTALMEVEHQVKVLPVVKPLPGFASRWRLEQSRRLAAQQRRQTVFTVIGFGVAAGVVLMLFVAASFMQTNPAEVLIGAIRIVADLTSGLEVLFRLSAFWAAMVPLPVSLALGAVASFGLGSVCLAWLCSLWRLSVQGEI